MRFCSQKVLEYLKNPRDKLVATMRNWLYRVNQRIVIKDCNGKRIGYGIVVDVAPTTTEILKKWLKYSGFNSIDEWLAEAKKLSGKTPQYVYLIYLL